MSFTYADYLAMQARLNQNKKNHGKMISFVDSPKKPEREIQEDIEEYLKSQSHQCWWDRKRMDMPTTSRCGIADFVGVFKGVAFGMEVKRPGEKPTTEQLGELLWMRKAGAKTAVVFSLEDAIEFLKSL